MDLKPCKCEALPVLCEADYGIQFQNSMGYLFQCPRCGVTCTLWFDTEEKAAEDWNRRVKEGNDGT